MAVSCKKTMHKPLRRGVCRTEHPPEPTLWMQGDVIIAIHPGVVPPAGIETFRPLQQAQGLAIAGHPPPDD